LCMLYLDQSDKLTILTQFIQEGIENQEKIIYIADSTSFKEEKEFFELELSIKAMEKQEEDFTMELNSGITDHMILSEIASKIKGLKDKIDDQTLRWLELSE